MRRAILITAAVAVLLPFAALPPLAAQQKKAAPQKRDLYTEEARPPAPRPSIPRSYALVIGISNYQNLKSEQQLRYAERDAESMFSILISTEGGNFPAENVHLLTGAKATLANIRRELEEWLPSVSREGDRVLIYFAGHGFVAAGKGHLAPYDIKLTDIANTGYPMTRLGEVFGTKIKGKWKVLLADACHSGAISPEATETINRGLVDLGKSVFVMSASRDREQSFESPDFGGGHGVFTYYVTRGLSGAADQNRDGIVTADEIADYVRTGVRADTKARQNPVADRGSFDPNMLLAYVPANAVIDPPKEASTGMLIIESNMDGVEVFVDGKSVGVLNKGTPLRLPGMAPGTHMIQGVKMGYEPDGPREETVYPGQESTVSIRIRFQRKRPKAALDFFEQGLKPYRDGGASNYAKAAQAFRQALQADATYSQAALYLARAEHAMQEYDLARKHFDQAIATDPDYVEARASYGGMLLDIGATDEAIRQLTAVVQRDASNSLAHTQLAAAYRMKDAYPPSIDAANQAIKLAPKTAEPHFWLADSLRLSGQYAKSIPSYLTYLQLSDFDSKLAGQLNFWVRGFLIGGGRKTRASQRDIWKDLRSLAYFGLCDAERKQTHYDKAVPFCQKALSYDPKDPYIHYALGLTFARMAEQTGKLENVATASVHFRNMLALNADLEQAADVKKMLASFDAVLKAN
ncbi:MAG: caspase family protein [Acidobacteria bacterium]|nr:caspase family protein [Acidobacteriota bacterium]